MSTAELTPLDSQDEIDNNLQGNTPEAHETTLDVELVICHNPNSENWEQAAAIEADIFVEKGYVTDRAEMDADYAGYLPASRMVVAKQGERVVGCIRMINYDPAIGFKTINDVNKGKLELNAEGRQRLSHTDLRSIIEVGTLGLDPEYRTRAGADEHMVTSLYGAIYATAMLDKTPNILASFDEEYFVRFSAMFGPNVHALGPAIHYMGSNTVPSVMNINELEVYFASIGAQDYVDEMAKLGLSMKHEY